LATTRQKKKKKDKRVVIEACVYIQATFNNTIVTVTDMTGNCLCTSSSGALGFRGSKKSTPYAAQSTMSRVLKRAQEFGVQKAHVFIKGPGMGRESAIRSIGTTNISVSSITDITPIPHNGCRPKKIRHG